MALKGVTEAAQELKAKRASAESTGDFKKKLQIDEGDTVTVRFLEQGEDFHMLKQHEVKKTAKSGKNYWQWVTCLDQSGRGENECPGCDTLQESINRGDTKKECRRTDRFYINTIWRDAPTYEKGEDGKYVLGDDKRWVQDGTADQIAFWTGGTPTAEDLDVADTKNKGLGTRDFDITRTGTGTDTRYHIDPAMDDETGDFKPKTELSKADKKLAEDKYDLKELTAAPAPEDFFGYSTNGPSANKANEKSAFGATKEKKKNIFTERKEQSENE